MNKQPEALRLADDLDRNCEMGWPDYGSQMRAAAELRRLHEVNQELLEALKLADAALWGANMNMTVVHHKVQKILAKAGEQP